MWLSAATHAPRVHASPLRGSHFRRWPATVAPAGTVALPPSATEQHRRSQRGRPASWRQTAENPFSAASHHPRGIGATRARKPASPTVTDPSTLSGRARASRPSQPALAAPAAMHYARWRRGRRPADLRAHGGARPPLPAAPLPPTGARRAHVQPRRPTHRLLRGAFAHRCLNATPLSAAAPQRRVRVFCLWAWTMWSISSPSDRISRAGAWRSRLTAVCVTSVSVPSRPGYTALSRADLSTDGQPAAHLPCRCQIWSPLCARRMDQLAVTAPTLHPRAARRPRGRRA